MTIEVKTSLGTKIRNWRTQRGLSQHELLAERFSESYLSKVEREQMHASEDFLAYVASRLGLTVEELSSEEPLVSTSKKLSRESQELILTEARIALQKNQYQEAKDFLNRLVLDQLPTSLLADYYFLSGKLDLELKNYDTAVLDLEQALKLIESDPKAMPIEVEQVRINLGLTHYRRGNLLLALKQHKRCLQAVEAGLIADPTFLAKLYYNLANEHQLLDEREQAFHFYKEAARYAERGENLNEQADIAWGLGLTYQAKGDLTLAKIYLNKSATLYESIESLKYASSVKGTLGKTMVERGEYETAAGVLNAALQTALQGQDSEALWTAYINLTYLYYEQGKLELAERHVQLSLECAQNSHHDLLLGQSMAQVAEIRLAQGDTKEGLHFFTQAEEILEKNDAAEHLQKICYRYAVALEKLGEVQEAMKMYRKAFEYQKRTKN